MKQHLWDTHAEEIAAIMSVATEENRDESTQKAKEAAQTLTPQQLANLPLFFHDNQPENAVDQQERFEGSVGPINWKLAVQEAIFEILFHRPEVSLPFVRSIAFGKFDWTQIMAIEILCEFAKDGIESEKIIEDIAEAMPQFRYEALMPAIDFVSSVGIAHPKLIQYWDQLIDEYINHDPVKTLYVIDSLIKVDKEHSKKHKTFLLGMLNGNGLENRDPELDGAVVDEKGEVVYWGPAGPPPAEIHQICAALTLFSLFPEDEAVRKKLLDWQLNHPDEPIRKHIEDVLNS